MPRKNIKMLAGKPLIAWTIDTALNTPIVKRIVVSTDDEEIAAISEECGAEAPFLRPKEFAGDMASDMEVYLHTLGWLAENEKYYPDIIVWLRPTAPLRIACDIENAVKKLVATEADWVRTVSLVEHHPYWMFSKVGDKLRPFVEGIDISKYLRRQSLPLVYRLNGVVDVAWRKTLVEKKLLYSGDVCACITPLERSVDIDTELDFIMAEAIISKSMK